MSVTGGSEPNWEHGHGAKRRPSRWHGGPSGHRDSQSGQRPWLDGAGLRGQGGSNTLGLRNVQNEADF